MVEAAALLDVLGVEHETVHLGIPRSKAALFAQDLWTGQAARGVARASPGHVLLPDHVEATVRTRLGISLQIAGWMAWAVAHDLEVGRRICLGLLPFSSASFPAITGQWRSTCTKPQDGLPPQT